MSESMHYSAIVRFFKYYFQDELTEPDGNEKKVQINVVSIF